MIRRILLATLILSSFIVYAQNPPDEQESGNKPCCGEKANLEKSENIQTECPVMGGKIDKEIFVDHEGKRIYFCCQACVESFKKDPAVYLKKLEEAGVKLKSTVCCEKKHCMEKQDGDYCCVKKHGMENGDKKACCENQDCKGCGKHKEKSEESPKETLKK